MKKVILALLLVAFVSFTGLANANTILQFVSDPGGDTIGAYNMKLNNGSLIAMVCGSNTNHITNGESWYVKAFDIDHVVGNGVFSPGGAPPSKDQWNEAAYFATLLVANPGNSQYQYDVWGVLGIGGSTGLNASDDAYYHNVFLADHPGWMTSATFYIPLPGNSYQIAGQTYSYGIPQPFIYTPEPSSLILLGFGLTGALGLRRRFRASWQLKDGSL